MVAFVLSSLTLPQTSAVQLALGLHLEKDDRTSGLSQLSSSSFSKFQLYREENNSVWKFLR